MSPEEGDGEKACENDESPSEHLKTGGVGEVESDVHGGSGDHVAHGREKENDRTEVSGAGEGRRELVICVVLPPVVEHHDLVGDETGELAQEHAGCLKEGMVELTVDPISAH